MVRFLLAVFDFCFDFADYFRVVGVFIEDVHHCLVVGSGKFVFFVDFV